MATYRHKPTVVEARKVTCKPGNGGNTPEIAEWSQGKALQFLPTAQSDPIYGVRPRGTDTGPVAVDGDWITYDPLTGTYAVVGADTFEAGFELVTG